MNWVDFTEIRNQLVPLRASGMSKDSSRKKIAQLRQIQKWLGLYDKEKGWFYELPENCRFAPSLIARSEAQFFGISFPRFAFRSYLDSDQNNFINLRRGNLFSSRMPPWSKEREYQGKMQPLMSKEEEALKSSIVKTLIGDCVFTIPKRLERDFFIISKKLGQYYDEDSESSSTPFVMYTDLTGVCAQAAAFISSVLLIDYCKGIFGLSEISNLAHSEEKGNFQVRALTPLEVSAYFSNPRVGMAAEPQTMSPLRYRHQSKDVFFKNALRSYVLSGFPVILQVDFGRLNGLGSAQCDVNCEGNVHETNLTGVKVRPESRTKFENQPSPHMVVIVGCRKSWAEDEFVLHDPYVAPYLVGNSRQLLDARPYFDDGGGGVSMRRLSGCGYQPVLPSSVRMPLQRTFNSNRRDQFGLFDLAFLLQHRFVETNFDFPEISVGESVGFAFLARADNIVESLNKFEEGAPVRYPALNKDEEALLRSNLVELVTGENWCWIQQFSNALFIWNAEKEPPLVDGVFDGGVMPDEYLLCVLAR